MNIIVGGRQTGRTTELIKLAAKAEQQGEVSYIVCHNHASAYSISKRAQEMGLNIGFPLTYDEFLNHRYAGSSIKNLYIDNIELLIQYMTPVHVAAITVTKEKRDDDG